MDIYDFILDFVSHWHGISHNVSVEKDKVTVTTFPDFGVEFHDFANAMEATEFIIKEYGWPSKADVIREANEEVENPLNK